MENLKAQLKKINEPTLDLQLSKTPLTGAAIRLLNFITLNKRYSKMFMITNYYFTEDSLPTDVNKRCLITIMGDGDTRYAHGYATSKQLAREEAAIHALTKVFKDYTKHMIEVIEKPKMTREEKLNKFIKALKLTEGKQQISEVDSAAASNYAILVAEPQSGVEEGVAPPNSGEQSEDTIGAVAPVEDVIEDPIPLADILPLLCSSQPLRTFAEYVGRWFAIRTGFLTPTTSAGTPMQAITLPKDIFGNLTQPIKEPFNSFIFFNADMEAKIYVNAPRTVAGKLIMHAVKDFTSMGIPINAVGGYYPQSPTRALLQKHAILDLSTSNSATLEIKQLGKKPFNTTSSTNRNTAGAEVATLFLNMLSEMRVGSAPPSQIPYTIYLRFTRAHFNGLRYSIEAQNGEETKQYTIVRKEVVTTDYTVQHVEFQGAGFSKFFDNTAKDAMNVAKAIPGLGKLVGFTSNAIGNLSLSIARPIASETRLKEVEKRLRYIGVIGNRDNPTLLQEVQVYLEHPTSGFQSCDGPEVAEVMRYDPTATTPMFKELVALTIESIREMCMMPGYIGKITLSAVSPAGTLVGQFSAKPGYTAAGINYSTPPVDYWTKFYTYYSGNIAFRFVFGSTEFHSGMVEASYIPFHADFNNAQAQAGYIQSYYLKDGRSFDYTVPYQDDTVMRFVSTASKIPGKGLLFPDEGTVKLYVRNPLNLISQVSTTIDVMVYKMACANFTLSGPCPANRTPVRQAITSNSYYGNTTTSPSTLEPDNTNLRIEPQAGLDEDYEGDLFPVGPPGGAMSNYGEDHMKIKNLLAYKVAVYASIIPAGGSIMQPILSLNKYHSNGTSVIQPEKTIQFALYENFRFGRGGQKIGLKFRTDSSNPTDCVYVTHIPVGPYLYQSNVAADIAPLHSKGYSTTLVYINKTPYMTFDIPHTGIGSYIDLQSNTGNTTEAPKHENIFNNWGHLAITSECGSPIEMTYFQKAADDFVLQELIHQVVSVDAINSAPIVAQPQSGDEEDFCLSNWSYLRIGTVPGVEFILDDDIIVDFTIDTRVYPQMEREEEVDILPPIITEKVTDQGNRIYSKWVNSTPYKTMHKLLQTPEKVTNTLDDTSTAMKKITSLASAVEVSTTHLKDIAHSMLEKLKYAIPDLAIGSVLFSGILQFLQVMLNPNWKSLCIAIIGILSSLGMFASDALSKMLSQLLGTKLETEPIPSTSHDDETHRPTEQQPERVEPQCMHSECKDCGENCNKDCMYCNTQTIFSTRDLSLLISIIIGGFTSTLGLKEVVNTQGVATGLFRCVRNFFTTVNGCVSVLTDLLKLVARIFNRFKNLRENTLVSELSEDNDTIRKFITEAALVTQAINQTTIKNNPIQKVRFWYVVSKAHQLKAKYALSKISGVLPLMRLCDTVINKANDCAIDHCVCPVRYEPYVIALEGQTKIGKSYQVHQWVPEILADKSVYGIESFVEPIYVRTPGKDFWDGYTSQPVIMYDDFMAILEPPASTNQVSEMFNLKSSAIFNLNMARLEEKQLRANPLMVIQCCNAPFAVPNGLADQKAFLRRRDAMYKVELSSEYQSIDDVPIDIKKNFGHLVYYKYSDVTEPGAISKQGLTYEEFKEDLKQDIRKYHLKEKENVEYRLKNLVKLLPQSAQEMINVRDPCEIFFHAYTKSAESSPIQSGLLPSQVLEAQATQLLANPQFADEESSFWRIYKHYRNTTTIGIDGSPTTMVSQLRTAYPRGHCIVCMEDDLELTHACVSNHAICSPCFANINARHSVGPVLERPHLPFNLPRTAISCPCCRQQCNPIILVDEDEISTTRAMFYWLEIKDKIRLAKNWSVRKLAIVKMRALQAFKHLSCNMPYIIALATSLAFLCNYHHLVGQVGKITQDETKNMLAEMSNSEDETLLVPRFENSIFNPTVKFDKIKMTKAPPKGRDHEISYAGNDPTYFEHQGTERDHISFYGSLPVFNEPILDTGFSLVHTYSNGLEKVEFQNGSNIEANSSKFQKMKAYLEENTEQCGPEKEALSRLAKLQFPGCVHPKWVAPLSLMKLEFEQLNADILIMHRDKPPETQLTPCNHEKLLYCDPAMVYFEEDAWVVGIEGTDLIPDKRCTKCLFDDPYIYKFICKMWASYRILTLCREISRSQIGVPNAFRDPILSLPPFYMRIIESIREYKNRPWTEILGGAWQKLGIAIKAGLMLTGILSGFRAMANFFSAPAEIARSQLVASGAFVTHTKAKSRPPTRAKTVQMQSSNTYEESMIDKIYRNSIVFLSVMKDGIKHKSFRGFGLFARTCILNGHSAKELIMRAKQGATLYVKTTRILAQRVVPCSSLIIRFDTNDKSYIDLPADFPLFSDITKQIPKRKAHTSIGTAYKQVQYNPKNGNMEVITGEITKRNCTVTVQGSDGDYLIKDVYETNIQEKGFCGGIYMDESQSPFFAMHAAGIGEYLGRGRGYGVPLIREDILALQKGELVLSQFTPFIQAQPQFELEGLYLPLGSVAKKNIPFQPTDTKIVPSLVHKDARLPPVSTQPTILSSKDKRYNHPKSPLYHGVIKHLAPIKPLPTTKLAVIAEHQLARLLYAVKPIRLMDNPLTISEAICGLDLDYYDPINEKTSAGYPYNLSDRKTKSDWLNIERDENGTILSCNPDPELVSMIELKEEARSRGMRPHTIFCDQLKDEKRKLDKVSRPDCARVFSLSPVDFTITTRMHTLDFVAAFKKARFDAGHAVGIACDGPEWTNLAQLLLEQSSHIITGDFTDFGPKLPAQITKLVTNNIVEWYKYNVNYTYSVEEQRKLYIHGEEMFNATHLAVDNLYQALGGSPSGAAITVELNCLVHEMLIKLAYLDIMENTDYPSLDDFDRFVLYITYGDDGIGAVNERISVLFNCETISKALAKYGIKYTDAHKLGTVKYQTLEESSFLKRSFKAHPDRPGHWLAALDQISIHDCVQWVWKSADLKAATQENINQSVQLAYGHGREYFDNWKNILNKISKDHGLVYIGLTWDALDLIYFGPTPILGEYTEFTATSLLSGNVSASSTRPDERNGLQAMMMDLTDELRFDESDDDTDGVHLV